MSEVHKAWVRIRAMLENHQAVLTAGEHGIPTIHDFAGKYHSTVQHRGFGWFEGSTEHGKFDFDAGGLMESARDEDGTWLAFTQLRASTEVLADLGYDFKKAHTRVMEILA